MTPKRMCCILIPTYLVVVGSAFYYVHTRGIPEPVPDGVFIATRYSTDANGHTVKKDFELVRDAYGHLDYTPLYESPEPSPSGVLEATSCVQFDQEETIVVTDPDWSERQIPMSPIQIEGWWDSGLLSAEPIDLFLPEGGINPKYYDLLHDKLGWSEQVRKESAENGLLEPWEKIDPQDEWWWYVGSATPEVSSGTP